MKILEICNIFISTLALLHQHCPLYPIIFHPCLYLKTSSSLVPGLKETFLNLRLLFHPYPKPCPIILLLHKQTSWKSTHAWHFLTNPTPKHALGSTHNAPWNSLGKDYKRWHPWERMASLPTSQPPSSLPYRPPQ